MNYFIFYFLIFTSNIYASKNNFSLKNYEKEFKTFRAKGGNPASEFCTHVGGKEKTIRDKELNEDSLCIFKDNSSILSWDLFYNASKKSGIAN